MLEDAGSGDPFLPRFLRIFEEISASLQDRIDGVEHQLDIGLADLRFVRWLGSWIGLDVDSSLPDAVQRRLVGAAGRWLAMRGTVTGLQGFVGDATGAPCRVLDAGGVFPAGQPCSFGPEVTVHVEHLGQLTPDQMQALIAQQLPAGSVASIEVGPLP
jgi:phage tail-like protein